MTHTASPKRIVVDIETNLKHDTIWVVCTQDIDTGEKHTWNEENSFQDYIKDATSIIGHNFIGFDGHLLSKLWKTQISLKKIVDTLILSRLLEPSREKGHSLESWGEQLGEAKTDYKAAWEAAVGRKEAYPGECFDSPAIDVMTAYCAQDVNVTCKLFLHLEKQLKEKEFSQESIDLEHKVGFIIAEQERNGFKLDVEYATLLLADIKREMDIVYEQMQQRWPPYEKERVSEKTGKSLKPARIVFNPGSRKQIGEKLQELGWKPEKFTETGQPVVDETVLSKVDIPEAQTIAKYLLLQKRVAQIESWFECLKPDGRVHGKVITNGAVTGRASHHSPNMAQVPAVRSAYGPDCRKVWTVDEGNVLVGVDLSGIELRCFAHYLNDPEYINEVINGDVHTKNQKAFGVSTRDVAKTVLYATLYGASPPKIGSIIGGSAAEGKKIIDSFERNVPAYAKLKQKVSRYAAKGRIPGLDGRQLIIRSEHSALNTLLQAAGAIIAKQWIVCFTERLKNAQVQYKLVAWVHDEVQIETKPEYACQVLEIVVQSAAQAGELLKFRCPVAAEGKTGANWYETH